MVFIDPIAPTAPNFRSEMARFRLSRNQVCNVIGMNPNLLTMYLNEGRPLSVWAAHNIGYGINRKTGRMIFDVDMKRGILPAEPWIEPIRQHHPSVVLPTKQTYTKAGRRERWRRRKRRLANVGPWSPSKF